MDAKLRGIEQNMENALKQRDEEWREKLDKREKELSRGLKEGEKAFISDQLKRDKDLLKIMKEIRMQWRKIGCKR